MEGWRQRLTASRTAGGRAQNVAVFLPSAALLLNGTPSHHYTYSGEKPTHARTKHHQTSNYTYTVYIICAYTRHSHTHTHTHAHSQPNAHETRSHSHHTPADIAQIFGKDLHIAYNATSCVPSLWHRSTLTRTHSHAEPESSHIRIRTRTNIQQKHELAAVCV